MDLANVSSALSAVTASSSSYSVPSDVSLVMLSNTMNANEAMNDSLLKMMENSVTPNLGSNFDMYV